MNFVLVMLIFFFTALVVFFLARVGIRSYMDTKYTRMMSFEERAQKLGLSSEDTLFLEDSCRRALVRSPNNVFDSMADFERAVRRIYLSFVRDSKMSSAERFQKSLQLFEFKERFDKLFYREHALFRSTRDLLEKQNINLKLREMVCESQVVRQTHKGIECTLPQGLKRSDLIGLPVKVFFSVPMGVCEFDTVILVGRDHAQGTILLEHVSRVSTLFRRVHVRRSISGHGTYHVAGSLEKAVALPCILSNLSVGGMEIIVDDELAVGACTIIRFVVADQGVEVSGEVVSVGKKRDLYFTRIRFTEISDSVRLQFYLYANRFL